MSDAIADLVTALGALTCPDKNGNGPDSTYSYTRLEDIDALARPILAAHGWVWTQDLTTGRGVVTVTTTLRHTSGETLVSSPLHMPCPRFGLQDIGAAATYGRRYQLAAMLGIPAGTDDNDAADQQPRPASDTQKTRMWELAALVWPDVDDTNRRSSLAAEVAAICAGARLDQLTDTQAVLVITQLEAATDTPEGQPDE